ncbi:hypothetical protein GQ43DRAFT_382213 [Delitschia confertaspora ATCC 74209]|uniref:Sulfite efflux pump SSU1 n=1 Tax=Delitschia confertaspora ATCC 74209 TaxID=1513339 RepID=A0A9P4MLC2_9PLEO|nr:hypothetical protein GQ43DRAFT_382213 [Delitschia confertaspora ATCC 74209]
MAAPANYSTRTSNSGHRSRKQHQQCAQNDSTPRSSSRQQHQQPRTQNGDSNRASRTTSSSPSDASNLSVNRRQDLTKYDVGWRRIVRNFSPSWFNVTMGTGVVSILLSAIPWEAQWLYWLSVIFFCLNALLFGLAMFVSILRYALYPEIWSALLADQTNSLFLGTIPIGFGTLIQSWIRLCVPYWGHWSVVFVWVCWMVDCVVAVACTISLTMLLISTPHIQALHRITAAQLLPIAATIVAASGGSAVAPHLTNPQHALGTVLASYVMWGMSFPLAMTVLVMYYQRLALHKLPPREVVVSSFLPLGPLGLGGYTILSLGNVARKVFPKVHFLQMKDHEYLDVIGEIFFVMGLFISLLMWGFALTWLCYALTSIHKSRPFPFNMGWWGFTFPLGVFALCTIEFGVRMPSLFFRVLGTIFAVMVILLWIVVAAGTCWGAWEGRLLSAPDLENLKEHQKGTTEGNKNNDENEKGDEEAEGSEDTEGDDTDD